jgi:hypothetical protein
MASPNVSQILLQVMSRPQYAGVVQAAAQGDQSAIRTLLSSAGVTQPIASDIDNVQSLAAAFDNFRESQSKTGQGKGKVRPTVDMSDTDVQKNFHETSDAVKNIMLGTPHERVLKGLGTAAVEGLDAAGDIAENNSNRLAAALMAGHRVNSNRQTEIYGPSITESAYENAAQNEMRRGTNTKRVLSGMANIVDKLLGSYEQARSMGATTAVGNTFGNIPSAAFDMASQGMRTSQKINKR